MPGKNKPILGGLGAVMVIASLLLAACAPTAPPAPTPTTAVAKAAVATPTQAPPPTPTKAPPPPPTPTPKPVEVTWGMVAGAGDQPVKVAKELGLDRKHGVDFVIKPYADFGILNVATAEAQVDIGGLGPGPVVVLRGQGKDIIAIFGFVIPANEVIVRADSPIRTFADLKGKKIGTHGGPAASTFLLFRVVTKLAAGFDPAKESTIQFGAPALVAGLLEKGELDAIVSLEPIDTQLLSTGKFRSIGEDGAEYAKLTGKQPPLIAVIASTERVGKQKGDALRSSIAAYIEAVEYMKTNKEIWTKIGEWDGIKEPKAVELYRERYKDDFITKWDKKIIQDQIDGLKALIEVNPDFAPGVPPGAFTDAYVPR